MCDELKDWIGEKINGINLDDVGKDLASVKVLQRKQQNLEQELKPIEEKLNKMNMMANAYVSRPLMFACHWYCEDVDPLTGDIIYLWKMAYFVLINFCLVNFGTEASPAVASHRLKHATHPSTG